MTDHEIVDKLLARDGHATHWFFYVKCRPLFLKLIKTLFNHPIEYDELVDEVVLFLFENDAYRLRQFDFRSSICLWLRTCLIRHFIKNGRMMIDDTSRRPLYPVEGESQDDINAINARLDVETYLSRVADYNPRHAYVLRRIMLDDAEIEVVAEELHVLPSNLYNIKKRAFRSLVEIALSIKKDENKLRHIR